MPRAFTPREVLVALAAAGILIGILLPTVPRVRVSNTRLACANNLKHLGMAAHGYEAAQLRLPAGIQSSMQSPFQGTVLVQLLSYMDQDARYRMFDTSVSATSAANHDARAQGDVPAYLCPADRSTGLITVVSPAGLPPGPAGRTNYYANLGAHAWYLDGTSFAAKPKNLTGMFAYGSHVRFLEVADGASNTVLFAEVKRGAFPHADSVSVTKLTPVQWNITGANAAANVVRNTDPTADSTFINLCNTANDPDHTTGLRYFSGQQANSVFYTHTLPPNYVGRDCMAKIPTNLHLAARSAHPGGVGVCFADGSVRFIRDAIPMSIWRAVGTRAGGETDTNTD